MTDHTEPGSPRRVQVGEHVVVKFAQDKGSYVLKADYNQKLGSSRVNLIDLVGEPFTEMFELKGRRFEHVHDLDGAYFDSGGQDEGDHEEEAEPAPASAEDAKMTEKFNNFTDSEINSYMDSLWATSEQQPKTVKGDNSGYVDTNTAQKLTTADIAKLRAEGLSGAEIIRSLTAHSETFGIKSDYAQAKYIRRKERKYRRLYQLLPCNPLTIGEMNTHKNRDRVMNLRFDSLAQILSHSGVHAHAHVLVFESMCGLITGAVAYRMQSGGSGRILTVYAGQQPHFESVRQFNLSPEDIAIIQPVPATAIGPAAEDVRRLGFHTPEVPAGVEEEEARLAARRRFRSELGTTTAAAVAGEDGKGEDRAEPVAEMEVEEGEGEGEEVAEEDDEGREDEAADEAADAQQEQGSAPGQKRKRSAETNPASDSSKGTRRGSKQRTTAQSQPLDNLHTTGRVGYSRARVHQQLRQGVDRLIIACKFRPLPILKQALVLLAPSAPFVIFHEFQEPLVDCYQYLTEGNLAVKLVLSETWCREFQNLPGRFRPDMFMSGTGGYLLTGIYVGMPAPYNVLSAEEVQAAAAHSQARQVKKERHANRGKKQARK